MDLTFEDRTAGTWSVLVVHGELDLHTSASLQEHLDSVAARNLRVAIDLSGVPFMDSSSLGVLVVNLKRIRERHGEMALVGAKGSPLKVLSITGIDRVIPSYATYADLPQA